VTVAVVDGPVDTTHPALAGASLRGIGSAAGSCRVPGSPACVHGTFVAGILAASRDSEAPALCPANPHLLIPIFCEAGDLRDCPVVTPDAIASSVLVAIGAGAKVINLSVGVDRASLYTSEALEEAARHAAERGVLLIAAAGNGGRIGPSPLYAHPWVIPVAAGDAEGRPLLRSNLGPGVGARGLLAPGSGVRSLASGGGYTSLTGTSVAAALVAGTAALLWAAFPDASAADVRNALLRPDIQRRTVVPPPLDADLSLDYLRALAR
jgi:subtilisin family serine protease